MQRMARPIAFHARNWVRSVLAGAALWLTGCGPVARTIEQSPRSTVRYVAIDSGSFLMGCVSTDDECDRFERPQHRVRLSRPFWIAATETTIGQYRRFVTATKYRTAAEWAGRGRIADARAPEWEWRPALDWQRPVTADTLASDDHPAVQLAPADAEAFCTWDGGRLPTEAEWEHAARGRAVEQRYTWGNVALPNPRASPSANGPDMRLHQRIPSWEYIAGYDDGYATLAPVARFDPNLNGLFDMSGNVYEWTADAFDSTAYAGGARTDPHVTGDGVTRVVRGGTWGYPPRHLRISFRGVFAAHGFWTATVGFRCARDRTTSRER